MIKIDREAVMKIAVNGDLFTLKKGMHELNLTVGGVPFREDGLVNQVLICSCLCILLNNEPRGDVVYTFYFVGEPPSGWLYEGVAVADGGRHLHTRNHSVQ